MSKFKISYTAKQKEVLEYAVNMAREWRKGNIEPIHNMMTEVFKRHHKVVKIAKGASDLIRFCLVRIREIDKKGDAFFRRDKLAGCRLSEVGEMVITENRALALEHLSELTARLQAGQVHNCFCWCNIPFIEHEESKELSKLTEFLHTYCWNMDSYTNHGINYSETSDILWDIYQVLRYQRYLGFSDEEKEEMRWSVMSDEPLHTAKEPLLRIERVSSRRRDRRV